MLKGLKQNTFFIALSSFSHQCLNVNPIEFSTTTKQEKAERIVGFKNLNEKGRCKPLNK
jgi:hypothetical protein